MTKSRGFSIVLHDLQNGATTKDDVNTHVKSKAPFQEYVLAQEPYTHQEGFHVHVFIRYKCQRHFKAVLSEWCSFWKSGRVQVDVMRGTMSDSCKYICEGKYDKDKDFDPNPIIHLDQAAANAAGVETQNERPQSDGTLGLIAFQKWIQEIRSRPRSEWI